MHTGRMHKEARSHHGDQLPSHVLAWIRPRAALAGRRNARYRHVSEQTDTAAGRHARVYAQRNARMAPVLLAARSCNTAHAQHALPMQATRYTTRTHAHTHICCSHQGRYGQAARPSPADEPPCPPPSVHPNTPTPLQPPPPRSSLPCKTRSLFVRVYRHCNTPPSPSAEQEAQVVLRQAAQRLRVLPHRALKHSLLLLLQESSRSRGQQQDERVYVHVWVRTRACVRGK